MYEKLKFFNGEIKRENDKCERLINFDNRDCGGVVNEVEKLMVNNDG
jgi:hypothetical protein